MLNKGVGWRNRRSKALAAAAAAMMFATLLSFVGAGPVSADDKDLSLGDKVSFSDGSPAAGVKVVVFEAIDPNRRGLWLGRSFTDANGMYSFPVGTGCYITVTVAPLGSSFGSVNSGVVYNQQYGCVEGGPNNNFDSVLYREDTKPPPTTTPPTTAPPTTPPPTTAPPTTAPPTTLPPTTVPPTQPPPTQPRQCTDSRLAGSGGWATWTYANDRGTLALHIAFNVSLVDPGLSIRDFERAQLGPLRRLVSQFGEIEYANVTTDGSSISIYIATKPGVQRPSQNPREEVSVGLVFGKKKYEICFKTKWNTVSPIGLDVDGSGAVERVSADVDFDFAGNNEPVTATEWFAPTEGILFDTRIEGPISGAHLFGDQDGLYADGFEKLALLDANADGQVAGAELDPLAIWTDANSNGRLDAGEQSSPADHGIVSLSTNHTNMVSTAALADGSVMVTEDLWFPTTPAAAATGNLVRLAALAAAGVALLGYVVLANRRRRNGLDAELAELIAAESTVR